MTEQELQDILQSDMRLWETAGTKDNTGESVTKVMDLPYDIGLTEVTLQGLTDAGKRRDAVSSFGNYVRSLVDEKVGEAAELEREAKALQKAAMAEPVAGEWVPIDVEGASLLKPFLTPDTVKERLQQVVSELLELKDREIALTLELNGLSAYMEAYDGTEVGHKPEDSETSKDDTS